MPGCSAFSLLKVTSIAGSIGRSPSCETRQEKRSDNLLDILMIEVCWNGFAETLKRSQNLIRNRRWRRIGGCLLCARHHRSARAAPQHTDNSCAPLKKRPTFHYLPFHCLLLFDARVRMFSVLWQEGNKHAEQPFVRSVLTRHQDPKWSGIQDSMHGSPKRLAPTFAPHRAARRRIPIPR